MRYGIFFALLGLSFILGGCTAKVADPKISMKPPKYVEEIPSKQTVEPPVAKGSLFGRGKNPLFSDRKAMNVNDILTVVISESTTQSSNSARNVAKDNSNTLGGGVFAAGGGGAASSVVNSLNKATNIGFTAESSNAFKASGSMTRDESFETTISARVIKILNNGNYFIEGSRELLVNGEKQLIQISGVIRPYDIDQSNTIDSKYIAEAKILYETQGDIADSTKKSWGTRLVESAWPF